MWTVRGEIMLAVARGTDAFCFDKARELAHGDWLTPLLVARAYFFYRNAGRGLQWAREAQSLKPDAAFPAYVVGECNRALGLIPPARAAYELACSLDPDFPLALPALRALSQRSWSQKVKDYWHRLEESPMTQTVDLLSLLRFARDQGASGSAPHRRLLAAPPCASMARSPSSRPEAADA